MRRRFSFLLILVLSELLFRVNANDYTVPGSHPTLSDALTVVVAGDRIILAADLQMLQLTDSSCPQGLQGSMIEIVAAPDTTITVHRAYIFRCNWYHIHHGDGHLIFEHSVNDDLIAIHDSYIHLGPLEFQGQDHPGDPPIIICYGSGGVLLQGLDIYGSNVGSVVMRCSGRIIAGRATVIRDSVFRGMDYGALDIEVGGYSLIERNYFVGSPRYAFLWLDDTNNLVRNNIFEISPGGMTSLLGGMITFLDDSATVYIRNNLLICNTEEQTPFYAWLDDFSTPPLQGISIVNNVVKGPCSNQSVFGGRAKTDSSILADGSVQFLHLSDWDGVSSYYDLDPGDSFDLTVSDVTFGEVSLAETGAKPDPYFRYDGRIDLIGADSVVSDDFAGDLRVGPTTSMGPFQFSQCPIVNADPNDGCLSCRGGWDWAHSCDSCVAGRDELGELKDCGSCLLENADPSHPTCSICLDHFTWDSSCTVCEENWDLDSACTECVSGFDWNEEKQACSEMPGIGPGGQTLGNTLGVVFGTILGVGFFAVAAIVIAVVVVILVRRSKVKSKDLEMRPVPPHVEHRIHQDPSSNRKNFQDFRTQEVDDGKEVSAPPIEYSQAIGAGFEAVMQDTRTSKASAPDYY